MSKRVSEKRMSERRQQPGRREEDPSKVAELTWQEACGQDRKVIQLLQEGYEKFTKLTIAALAVLLLITCIAVFLSWKSDKRSEHLADQNVVLVNDNIERIHDIQKARFEAAFNECVSTNDRNRNTIKRLNGAIDKLVKKNPSIAKQAAASKATNDFIIQALVPFNSDCTAFAQSVVKGTTGPGH